MSVLDRLRGVVGELGIKAPCMVATTANITLAGLQTIDGVSVTAGKRVLVWRQTNTVENGIWDADSGAWSRAVDFNAGGDCVQATMVRIAQGSSYTGTLFELTTAAPIIGTSALTFEQVDLGGGGSGFSEVVKTSDYTAGVSQSILADTRAGAWTLSFPASPSDGDRVSWADRFGSWPTNNLTVDPNGNTLDGESGTWTFDVSYDIEVIFSDDDGGWVTRRLIPLFAGAS